MAKFSRGHYELLAEALGHGLADVMERGSPHLNDAAMTMARKLAGYLAYDNRNFDSGLFIENIQAQAELALVVKNGVDV